AARQKFVEPERVGGQRARIVALRERRDRVGEAQQAARLEADDGNSAREKRGKCIDAALRFAPCLVDEADGEKGAPAAERTAVAVGGVRGKGGAARGGEERRRGPRGARLRVSGRVRG